tara:strand:+ start:390 stop:827 length:438 start_codon:yes stop_codon:yes gene_type:complete
MNEKDKNIWKETGLICAIGLVLFITLSDVGIIESKSVSNIPSEEAFYQYPLVAWQSENEDGDIVKIKYLVEEDNTKVRVYDSQGKKVHEQPFDLDRHKDGRDRIMTYNWKLYRTEWSKNIVPGIYTITVGTVYQESGRSIEIEVS